MRSRRTLASAFLGGVLVFACAGEEPAAPDPGGAESPEGAVSALIEHLERAEFEAAGSLSMPGQAALASLAEGATFSDVADALEDDDSHVASNFWAGFAQGTGGYLAGATVGEAGEPVVREGVEFRPVTVRPGEGPARTVFVREEQGYRIDVFASFAAGLADRMPPAVERLLTTNTDDARLILDELEEVVPSLMVAADRGNQPSEATQQILRLVELVTRVR
ncbi:MAG: hypothetical protein KY394_04335 [Actinobacteria bacterium]|nr:hypothetical protein [Actinomycetota bacterium]